MRMKVNLFHDANFICSIIFLVVLLCQQEIRRTVFQVMHKKNPIFLHLNIICQSTSNALKSYTSRHKERWFHKNGSSHNRNCCGKVSPLGHTIRTSVLLKHYVRDGWQWEFIRFLYFFFFFNTSIQVSLGAPNLPGQQNN